jgi:divalent anion:Na+ symporter, DASS family
MTSELTTTSDASRGISRFLPVVCIGLVAALFLQPEGLSTQGWHLLVIFCCTIASIILKPLPMGAISFIALGFVIMTKIISLQTVLNGFANELIWLIVMACFLARSLIKTGLGHRIAFRIISTSRGHPIGISYALSLICLILAPLVPSSAARAGGIIMPVLASLIGVIETKSPKGQHLAPFLLMSVLHSTVITSAMFLTANVGNPILVKLSSNFGIEITWFSWAMAAFLPGIISLLFLPLLLNYFLPCEIDAPERVIDYSKSELEKMGRMSTKEKLTLSVFIIMLICWTGGNFFSIPATASAILGVGLLLLFEILSWQDIINEELAWDTFFWVATLVTMAGELQALGVISFITGKMAPFVSLSSWPIALVGVSLIYFYSHYFFASNTAHITSMFAPFLVMGCTAGCPPLLFAMVLSFFSSLFGGMTHYASSPAPILFAYGYVDLKTWWKIGAITGIYYLIVWLLVGSIWWKLLGIY